MLFEDKKLSLRFSLKCPLGEGNWAARQGQKLCRGNLFTPRQPDVSLGPLGLQWIIGRGIDSTEDFGSNWLLAAQGITAMNWNIVGHLQGSKRRLLGKLRKKSLKRGFRGLGSKKARKHDYFSSFFRVFGSFSTRFRLFFRACWPRGREAPATPFQTFFGVSQGEAFLTPVMANDIPSHESFVNALPKSNMISFSLVFAFAGMAFRKIRAPIKIKSALPPPPKKSKIPPPPPKTRNFMEMGLSCRKSAFVQASIKLTHPFPAPELRAKIFTDTGIFLKPYPAQTQSPEMPQETPPERNPVLNKTLDLSVHDFDPVLGGLAPWEETAIPQYKQGLRIWKSNHSPNSKSIKVSTKVLSEPIFGQGIRRSTFQWKKKGVFSEEGGGIQWMRGLVRISTGKAIQWRGSGHSVNRRTPKIEKLLTKSTSQKSAPKREASADSTKSRIRCTKAHLLRIRRAKSALSGKSHPWTNTSVGGNIWRTFRTIGPYEFPQEKVWTNDWSIWISLPKLVWTNGSGRN